VEGTGQTRCVPTASAVRASGRPAGDDKWFESPTSRVRGFISSGVGFPLEIYCCSTYVPSRDLGVRLFFTSVPWKASETPRGRKAILLNEPACR